MRLPSLGRSGLSLTMEPMSWLFLLFMTVWFSYRVVQGWIAESVRYGPFSYEKDESPFLFWFMMAVNTACLLFVAWLWSLLL